MRNGNDADDWDEHIDYGVAMIDDSLYSLSRKSVGDDIRTNKKKFLFRLAISLHGAGFLSFRTEDYIQRIARVFDLNCICTVFPVSAVMAFHDSGQLNASSSESYTLRISNGLDCSKLSMLDQLCFDIIRNKVDFETADERLQSIEDKTPLYNWYTTALAYGAASFSSTTLFFGGTWLDGGWAFVFGLLVYGLSALCEQFYGLTEIQNFISSFVVALIASALDKYVYNHELCLYGQLFGGIVWLLPGITITIALLEIYSRMIVYGTSRLVYGISQASQLGFGLTFGCRLIFPHVEIPDSFVNGCRDPVNAGFGFLLLPLATVAFGIILNAQPRQLPGMIVCAGVGQIVGYAMSHASSETEDATPFIAALAVTGAARLFARFCGKQRPLIYIISGLLVLVPGGIGVKGMSNMWSGDMQSGMEFTFKMVMIGVCLAVGVFLALLPRKNWMIVKRSVVMKLPNDIKSFLIPNVIRDGYSDLTREEV